MSFKLDRAKDMALKIELEGCGPGRGRLRVSGICSEPESVVLAIQRNDGRYLGVAEVWQTTPYWHPQYSVQPESAGLMFDVDSEIIDGVIAVGGIPLRVLLRVDGAEDFGILRVKGELIGSGAAMAAADSDSRDRQRSNAGSAAGSTPGVGPAVVDRGALADAEDLKDDSPKRSGVGPWLILVLAVLAPLGAAWYFGLLDDWLGRELAEPGSEVVAEAAPLPQVTPMPEAESAAGPEPEPVQEPRLSGIALARSILGRRPAPDVIYARAEQAEQQGDCAAALILLNAAAEAQPRFAAGLARRYDPQTFAAGGCIEQPDAPYAIVFFADAAQVGDLAAQRRLGQLMTERERSGATHEEGLDWLRKAAKAGDEEAERALTELRQ